MKNLEFTLVILSRTLLSVGIGLLAGFKLSIQSLLPVEAGTTVNDFQDNFSGNALAADCVVRGANVYSVSGGLLHVTLAEGDPNHLLYELPGYDMTVQEVLARIRVLNFGSRDQCRCGLAVGVNSRVVSSLHSGQGIRTNETNLLQAERN
jgi:hypothetical protein